MEVKDRDFVFHYPAKVEGSPSLLRVVHKPTGCQAEGYLSDRDAIIEGVRRQVEKIGGLARDIIEKAKEPVDAV